MSIATDRDAEYLEILARLQSRGRFGMRLGLARTRALLRALGNPHRSLRGVLIGGTNGKGSTQALVGTALREAGYRVGQTPKPHLVSYRERIQVDGQPISVEDFTALLTDVMTADDKLWDRHGPSTEFEVLTSAAFLHFARAGVHVGVIEVGIGGRLDATNVWQGGVTAITNVALDHMEVLGPTIVAIAKEKSMIIKRGDAAAVTGAVAPGLAVIKRRAARVDVPLTVTAPFEVVRIDRGGTHVAGPDGALTVGLLGAHQAANAAVAWNVLDALSEAGIAKVSAQQRATAFAAARWPGRMELISAAGQPNILLDGAHNPHGVAALATSLVQLQPHLSGGPVTVLMGILANHWQERMLDPLIAVLPAATVFATGVPDSPNAMPADRLAYEWGGAGVRAIADPDAAFDAALANARNVGGLLLVCGSLYLVGHVRGRIVGSDRPAQ